MKEMLLMFVATIFSLVVMAQGDGNGKGKDKQKEKGKSQQAGNNKEKENKEKKDKTDHDKKVWEGTSENGGDGPKPSKNQPAQVTTSFKKDYPNTTNVSWSKYRGDWTATFGNGSFLSTAVYHANGERKDTRTPIARDKVPKNVQESILKERPDIKLDDAIKIEGPKGSKDIYRIKDIKEGKPEYKYYDADGKLVKYDY